MELSLRWLPQKRKTNRDQTTPWSRCRHVGNDDSALLRPKRRRLVKFYLRPATAVSRGAPDMLHRTARTPQIHLAARVPLGILKALVPANIEISPCSASVVAVLGRGLYLPFVLLGRCLAENDLGSSRQKSPEAMPRYVARLWPATQSPECPALSKFFVTPSYSLPSNPEGSRSLEIFWPLVRLHG